MIGYSGRCAWTCLVVVSELGEFLRPLPYGNQQLTGPRRFRFVKSAVLKIGSGDGGRGRGAAASPSAGSQSSVAPSACSIKEANDTELSSCKLMGLLAVGRPCSGISV